MSKFDGFVLKPVVTCMDAISAAAATAAKGDDDERQMLLFSACALMLRLGLDADSDVTVSIINNAFSTSGWRLVMEN